MRILANLAWMTIIWGAGVLSGVPRLMGQFDIGPVSQLSAVGALIVALLFLLKVYIPSRDKQYSDTITDVVSAHTQALQEVTKHHEHWETVRHEDHQQLSKAINDLRVNCSEVQTKLRADWNPQQKDKSTHRT